MLNKTLQPFSFSFLSLCFAYLIFCDSSVGEGVVNDQSDSPVFSPLARWSLRALLSQDGQAERRRAPNELIAVPSHLIPPLMSHTVPFPNPHILQAFPGPLSLSTSFLTNTPSRCSPSALLFIFYNHSVICEALSCDCQWQTAVVQ